MSNSKTRISIDILFVAAIVIVWLVALNSTAQAQGAPPNQFGG